MTREGEGACRSLPRVTEEKPMRLCGVLPGRRRAGKTKRVPRGEGEHTPELVKKENKTIILVVCVRFGGILAF